MSKLTGKNTLVLEGATTADYDADGKITQDDMDDFSNSIAGKIEEAIRGDNPVIEVRTNSYKQLKVKIIITVELEEFQDK